MHLRVALTLAVVSLCCVACGNQPVQEVQSLDAQTKADLELFKDARILFNHQSVGKNVINGLRRLSEQARVDLRILEHEADNSSAQRSEGGYFLHASEGQNNKPYSKIEAFEQLLKPSDLPSPDIALMKFCYVDIKPNTDIPKLFDEYNSSVERLERGSPSTTVVHVTIPLTVREPLWKELMKRFLLSTGLNRLVGIEDGHGFANIKRHQFNDMLRKTYAEQVIYDLATVESTHPDGTKSEFVRGDTAYPALAPEFAADLGHLNALGEDLAARRLVAVIADVLRARNAEP